MTTLMTFESAEQLALHCLGKLGDHDMNKVFEAAQLMGATPLDGFFVDDDMTVKPLTGQPADDFAAWALDGLLDLRDNPRVKEAIGKLESGDQAVRITLAVTPGLNQACVPLDTVHRLKQLAAGIFDGQAEWFLGLTVGRAPA